jgi:hypothetical protein
MARPKKLAQLVVVLPAREWASLDEAFDRVKLWVGSVELTRRKLRQDLVDGQLQAAALCIARDGTETWLSFSPAWWQPLKISPPILLHDSTDCCRVEGEAEGWDRKLERRYFLVRRAELDKLYPGAELDKLYPVAAPNEQADNPTSPRRTPGPRPEKDWPAHVERELIRRGLGKMTAEDLCQFCEDTLDYQPDVSAMRKLLRRLLNK